VERQTKERNTPYVNKEVSKSAPLNTAAMGVNTIATIIALSIFRE
jgi:hypothetical protein